jgi:predicted MFS family arabinose efflux permease
VSASAGAPARGLFGARIFLILAIGYLMSYGLRAINATIAPELSRELSLSNTSLGTLTSAYFVGFAAMQVPLGVFLDRFGPRRVNATLLTLAAASCAVIAVADRLETLWIARLVMGVGFAAGLMAPFAMFRIWFAADQQMRLAAWVLMFGTFGVMAATAPVRLVMPTIGWRGVFATCAGLLLLIAAAMCFGLPRSREPDGSTRPSFLQSLAGYGDLLSNAFFWRMVMLSAAMQGTFISLQTLWLGPWFVRVLDYTPQRAAEALFVFNAMLLVAYLVNGLVAPRLARTLAATIRTVGLAVPISVAILLLIAAMPRVAGIWGWLLLAVMTTIYTPVQARVAMAFPARMGGRALTAFNLVVFSSVIVIQSLVGLLVDGLIAAGRPQVDAFRISFGVLALLQTVAWLRFITWRRASEPGVIMAR